MLRRVAFRAIRRSMGSDRRIHRVFLLSTGDVGNRNVVLNPDPKIIGSTAPATEISRPIYVESDRCFVTF